MEGEGAGAMRSHSRMVPILAIRRKYSLAQKRSKNSQSFRDSEVLKAGRENCLDIPGIDRIEESSPHHYTRPSNPILGKSFKIDLQELLLFERS